MPTLTKLPEQCPVDIAMDKMVAWTVGQYDGEMCVVVYLSGGWSFHVMETMEEIRSRLPVNQIL